MFRSGAQFALFSSKGLTLNIDELTTPEPCLLGFGHIISYAVLYIIYDRDSKTF